MTAVMDQPLPAGLTADPTYLAFLRGMGMDATTANATALQHIAAARAAYTTAMQREPGQLRDEIRGVNGTYSGNNNFFSGGRLADVAEQRVHSNERQNDYATAQAGAISDANLTLQQQLSALARQNVDQIGGLQGRHDELANQDRYIDAVRAQALQTAGGGSGFGALPPAPPSQHDLDVFSHLNPAQLKQFGAWVSGKPLPTPAAPAGSPIRESRRVGDRYLS